MKGSFHVNDAGEAGICQAEVKCPFGGESNEENHYSTLEEAKAESERRLSEKHGNKQLNKRTQKRSMVSQEVTQDEAHNLLQWVGNMGVESDVDLYDGGEEMTSLSSSQVYFGFTTDAYDVDEDEVAHSMVNGAHMLKHHKQNGILSDTINENPTKALDDLKSHMTVQETHVGKKVVFWNIPMEK